MPIVKTLARAEIVVSWALNIRAGLDQPTVLVYKDCYDLLPPVDVYLVDGQYYLTDGFHRMAAADLLERASIVARVFTGTMAEAQEAALLANLNHGLHLTAEERKQAARRLLILHPTWANNRLSRALRGSPTAPTIAALRRELEAAGEIEVQEFLEGDDGKARPQHYVTSPPDRVEPLAARESAAPARRDSPGAERARAIPDGDEETGGAEGPTQEPGPAAPGEETLADEQNEDVLPAGLTAPTFPVVVVRGNGQRWELCRQRIEDWAAEHHGERYHAFISDMPYHLQDVRNGSQRQPGTGPFGRHTVGTRGFMQQDWDGGDLAFRPETWQMAAEQLYPGAFLIVYAAPRNEDLVATAMREAGLVLHPTIYDWAAGEVLDIPDILVWLTGQGMPKGSSVAKRLDQALGVEGEVLGPVVDVDGRSRQVGQSYQLGQSGFTAAGEKPLATAPGSFLAQAFDGHRHGLQSLRPNAERIIIAQKPPDGTHMESITMYGTGTYGIDRVRIAGPKGSGVWGSRQEACQSTFNASPGNTTYRSAQHPAGRVPSNFIVTHTPKCQPAGEAQITPLDGPRRTAVQQQADGLIPFSRKPVGYQKTGYTDADGTETISTWACLCTCLVCGAEWITEGRRPCPECGSGQVEWLCPAKRLDEQSGNRPTGKWCRHTDTAHPFGGAAGVPYEEWQQVEEPAGGASRYYFNAHWLMEVQEAGFWWEVAQRLATLDQVLYTPKAAAGERDAGLRGHVPCVVCGQLDTRYHLDEQGHKVRCRRNRHPTVKPLSLSLQMATMVLPPPMYEPRLLNWCAGSGTEAIAGVLAGYAHVTAVEMGLRNCVEADLRLRYWTEWASSAPEGRPFAYLAQRLAWLQELVAAE